MKALTLHAGKQYLAGMAMALASVSLMSCNSDSNDNDPDTGVGTAGLDQLSAQAPDSLPVADGLDSAQADLLTRFPTDGTEPFPIEDGDTVESLLKKN